MKLKIQLLSLVFLTYGLVSVSYATEAGFYLGTQAGISKLSNGTKNITINTTGTVATVTPSNTGLGARIYGGYQSSKYFGMELGWTYFTPSTYKVTGLAGNTLCSDPTIREQALDFSGKGMFPLANTGFDLFGKAGIAIARQVSSGSLVTNTGTCGGSGSKKTTVAPLIGLGASYDFTQNWQVDASYTKLFNAGGIRSASLMALGISYHYVDKMCGQFLC